MKKKILLLFAILAMAVSASADNTVISYTASAEVTPKDGTITGASGTLTIVSKNYNSDSKEGTITFSGEVTSIGASAFYNCTGLTSMEIPNSVTSIGESAFYGCTAMTSVTIPNSVTSIGREAFSGCTGLTSVEIPNSVTTIGNYAFHYCESLTSVEIGNSVTSIGNYAFEYCFSLTSVTIGNSVTTIGNYAFYYCSSLTSVTIGNSVTTIGEFAFAECTNLAEIISLRTTPPGLGTMCFNNVHKTTCKVKVPSSAVSAYQDVTGWSAFKVDESNSNITAGYIYTDEIPYTNNSEVTGCKVFYTRNFTHTGWQALFLPFAMNYSDWSDKGTVAELTGVSSEGVLLWTTIESGSIEAGKPYIFKPNAAGNVTFSVSSATLVPNSTIIQVNPKISGTETLSGYTLNGTYTEKTDMADTKAYALSNGNFYYAANDSQTLKPYRIFLTVPESVYAKKAPIRSSINGEGTTEIEGIDVDFDFDAVSHQQINLFGQPVGNDYKGIVIVNGKKIIRK